ncbi:MAG: DUF3386 family protein [Thermoleophilia bacterium]
MAVADLLRRDEADALVREAHLNVHRYPAGFPGFRARLRLSDERGVRVGRATLCPSRPPHVDMDTDERSHAWLLGQLDAMTGDRWHRPYADADGRFDKDMPEGQEGPLGAVVHLDDDALSTYWIENGHVTRAGRTTPAGRMTVLVQDNVVAPDGAAVATHFTVTVQDESTGTLLSVDTCRDAWAERWGVLVPARRRVVSLTGSGSTMRDLVIDHHELLDRGAG